MLDLLGGMHTQETGELAVSAGLYGRVSNCKRTCEASAWNEMVWSGRQTNLRMHTAERHVHEIGEEEIICIASTYPNVNTCQHKSRERNGRANATYRFRVKSHTEARAHLRHTGKQEEKESAAHLMQEDEAGEDRSEVN